MKKLLSLLLILVLLFSLSACGKNEVVSSSEDVASSNNNYSAELSKILCDYNWKCTDMPWELNFSEDNAVIWKMDEEETYTWEYSGYLNSMSQYTAAIQHDPEFSENYGIYIGSIKDKGQLLLGVDKTDNSFKMYFHGKFWRIKEEAMANHPQLKYVIGKWELAKKDKYNQDEAIPCSTVEIKEDGSCIIDGIMGTYSLSFDATDDFLNLDIFVENEHLYTLGLFESRYSVAVWSKDYEGAVDTSWTNTTATNILDITKENFRDYFELTFTEEFNEDVFGDKESFSLNQNLSLKKEYIDKIIKVDEFYFELGGFVTEYELSVNTEDETYTLEKKEETFITQLESYSFRTENYSFGNLSRCYIKLSDTNETQISKTASFYASIDDIEVARIAGKIYTKIE